ncbi:MAG TPA: hypothetical protein ENH26_00610 [Candidatus Wolfebacteria bacterium]|nr:hypothetical protein [Candidatus Wolfebacteria bacterium]
MNNEKCISLPESILLIMYIGFTDLIGIILIFFGLDDFLILDLITFPVTQFYFRIKGVRSTYDLATNILECIPYLGALPMRTVGLIITIYLANHPTTTEGVKVAKAVKIIK